MKVTRAGLLLLSCLAILSIAGIRARSSRYAPEPALTFAQLADTHLFDEGEKPGLPDVHGFATNNWNALHWSVDRINSLARGGKTIDFVVYTGDLGLRNIAFSNSRACAVKPIGELESGPPSPEQSASDKLVAELDRLTVRTVFFVSGRNDAPGEDGTDERFACFLLRLQETAQTLNRPLRIQELGPDHCFALKGFRLLGLSSSSVDKTTRLIREQVPSAEPTLLFTNVPDLKDPASQQPAWNLKAWVRREWECEASRPNILGIFAGHFPDVAHSFHGGSGAFQRLALDSRVAAKTYVAPPLATDEQTVTTTIPRGFLVVTANRNGIVSSVAQWFKSPR